MHENAADREPRPCEISSSCDNQAPSLVCLSGVHVSPGAPVCAPAKMPQLSTLASPSAPWAHFRIDLINAGDVDGFAERLDHRRDGART